MGESMIGLLVISSWLELSLLQVVDGSPILESRREAAVALQLEGRQPVLAGDHAMVGEVEGWIPFSTLGNKSVGERKDAGQGRREEVESSREERGEQG